MLTTLLLYHTTRLNSTAHPLSQSIRLKINPGAARLHLLQAPRNGITPSILKEVCARLLEMESNARRHGVLHYPIPRLQ